MKPTAKPALPASRPFARLPSGLMLLLVFGELTAANLPLRWRWSYPTPHGANIVDMAYSPTLSLAVQVAERGQLYTSDNLSTWLPRDSA